MSTVLRLCGAALLVASGASVSLTLADDVASDAKLGMSFTYYGCNDRGCYPVVKNHEATVQLAGGGSSVVDGNEEPAVPGDAPADHSAPNT